MTLLTPYWPIRRSTSSDLFAEMERMFEDLGQKPLAKSAEQKFTPACEIAETEAQYFMSMDLPGVKREDIKVEINENTLTISGERKQEKKAEDERNAKYVERQYGAFIRTFTLPSTADAEKIEAHYEDGVLNLTIPKATIARTRKIEIQSKPGG